VSPPAPALRPYIAHYAGFRAHGLPAGTHTGLPSRHVHLIISLGPPIDVIQMPNAWQSPAAFRAMVCGLQDAPATIRVCGNLHGLHVFMTPLGARAILGVNSAELSSQVVNLSDIWGRTATRMTERLMAASTWQQRFEILDQVFTRALRPVTTRRELAWAWSTIARTHGSLPIEKLARDLGWSRRHFGETFHAELGVAPKTAARIFRFEHACRLIMDQRPSLAHVAAECGFHDQAHMTREWNALAGCTPGAWIAKELPILQDYEVSGGDNDVGERNANGSLYQSELQRSM